MGVRNGDREAHGSPLNLQAKLKIINTKEDHRDEKKGKERKGEDFNYVSMEKLKLITQTAQSHL